MSSSIIELRQSVCKSHLLAPTHFACEAVFLFLENIWKREKLERNMKDRGSERKRESGENFIFLFLKIRNML